MTETPYLTQEQILEKLKDIHIHFATPCYGGMMHEACASSYIRFTIMAIKLGIKFSLDTMTNESLVPRARNNLVSKFLANKEATHLMFVDADLRWEPESIIRLALTDAKVVCGLYPMKGLPIRYVLNTIPDGRQIGTLLEVSTAGNGFMMIDRDVITDLIEKMPETKYADSLNYDKDAEKYMYALFDTMIDESGHYLSEDWTFCKRVREILKIPIWVDTDIKLDHYGTYAYKGDTTVIKGLADKWIKEKIPNDLQNIAYEEFDTDEEFIEDEFVEDEFEDTDDFGK